jgi:hypothetical protein
MLREVAEYDGATMKTSLVFLYRLLIIVLLAWIAYTQTLVYRGRPVPVTVFGGLVGVHEPVKVEIEDQPVRVESDAFPLEVRIVR